MWKMASNVLNNLDTVAKETLEEPKISATSIRSKRRDTDSSLVDQGSTDNIEISEPDANTIMNIDKNEKIVDVTNQTEDTFTLKDGKQDKSDITAYKKKLQAKDKEIEGLNVECLELEKQVDALKREVAEAWSTFRNAQEKSAVKESELQDEIRQIQKGKTTDRQQSIQQIQKVTEDLEEATRQVKLALGERDALQVQLDQVLNGASEWRTREKNLEAEIQSIRDTSRQALEDMQNKILLAEEATIAVRNEQSHLLRLSQDRQARLEKDNSELITDAANKQREVLKLQRMLEKDGKDKSSLREVDGLRQQLTSVTLELEEKEEKFTNLEMKLRNLDCEYRAAVIISDDEKLQLNTLVNELRVENNILNDQISNLQKLHNMNGMTGGGIGSTSSRESGIISSISENDRNTTTSSIGTSNIRSNSDSLQITNLSQQLLRKQAMVQELQSEKSAIKSRLDDYIAKCRSLEQQLAVDDDDLEEAIGSSSNNGTMARRRRLATGSSTHKVSKDLEKIGVKANARVAQAVDMIDTWTLVSGRFLKHYPLARLGFVLYLLVLHLWVLFILALHTHSLDANSQKIPG